MHLADTYRVNALSNTLFYEANEIMYDYYDGKLTKEDVKLFFKDYLYHSVGEVEENNVSQKKRVTAYVSTIYELFTRGNMQNAVNHNQKEGQNFLKKHGLDGHNEFYYNAKWYWKSEEMQELFQETANEITTEYGAEAVDFDSVIENTKYTLAGGLSFNGVWNWRQWNLSVFMQNSSHSFSSLLLDKHNWNDTVSKESYIKVSDILKNFHMEHYRNNRFEFFWMGNEN